MEDWIREGRVIVNGVTATIGTRVSGQERINVDGRPLRLAAAGSPVRILLYHKPEGEIVTREDPGGRDTVFSHLPRLRGAKWLAVGRLDVNTSGLLIFTTSGDLANRMMHPRFDVEREYAVRIFGKLSDEQLHQLGEGIALADGLARCEQVTDAGGEGSNHWYRLVVKEGRNRLVRRVFEALGYTVSRLIRVRFGVVELPSRLRRRQSVELSAAEVARLADWLAQSGPAAVAKSPRAPVKTRNHRRRSSAAK
jgi:23S rRNA pseudouridine2605 synthase